MDLQRIACHIIVATKIPRSVHPIVRGQLVITSRRPIIASGLSAMRAWRGTESETVESKTTPRIPAENQARKMFTPSGRSNNNHSAVTPSTAMGSPTTLAVRA